MTTPIPPEPDPTWPTPDELWQAETRALLELMAARADETEARDAA